MGPLRNKSVSVRLEEEAYLRLRRHSLRSGVPTSALVRALVHRWLQEQVDQERESVAEREGPERRWQPGLFGEGDAP
jgi:predicted DNA-binding protein